MHVNISNILSFLRGPLAFLLLSNSPSIRGLAIILAMITDCLDGYIARRYHLTSQFGAFLDPLMDKFFVFFALFVFIFEGHLEIWQALALISRDFAVILFGCYLALKGYATNVRFKSIWSGKISTTLQFFVLLALTFQFPIPLYVFLVFIGLGFLALFELYMVRKEIIAYQD